MIKLLLPNLHFQLRYEDLVAADLFVFLKQSLLELVQLSDELP